MDGVVAFLQTRRKEAEAKIGWTNNMDKEVNTISNLEKKRVLLVRPFRKGASVAPPPGLSVAPPPGLLLSSGASVLEEFLKKNQNGQKINFVALYANTTGYKNNSKDPNLKSILSLNLTSNETNASIQTSIQIKLKGYEGTGYEGGYWKIAVNGQNLDENNNQTLSSQFIQGVQGINEFFEGEIRKTRSITPKTGEVTLNPEGKFIFTFTDSSQNKNEVKMKGDSEFEVISGEPEPEPEPEPERVNEGTAIPRDFVNKTTEKANSTEENLGETSVNYIEIKRVSNSEYTVSLDGKEISTFTFQPTGSRWRDEQQVGNGHRLAG
jgi:hypothetical protein